jgi:hypothetical protein
MKHSLTGWGMLLVLGVCTAVAQAPRDGASSTSSSPDPLAKATKPLTPASASSKPHRTSIPVPKPGAAPGKANAELLQLERQGTRTPNSPKASPKTATVVKPADKPIAGSGINFTYQKPQGGLQSSNATARTPNSTVPRVKKTN